MNIINHVKNYVLSRVEMATFISYDLRRKEAIIEAERIHGSDNWELDTILEEIGNCYLYEKLGYCKTGKIEKINDKLTLVFYKK